MRRREFMKLLGSGVLACPISAAAQQHMHVVGILAAQRLAPIERLEHKLQEYGYIDGKNLQLVSRFVKGDELRYSAMAAELVALPVDLIVTWGTLATMAVKQATSSIPVVMGAIGDPVSVGIVTNLARPNGNITGFAAQNVDLDGKRLELLKDLVPHLSRVGMLANSANPLIDASLRALRPTAKQLRIDLEIFDVGTENEIENALQRIGDAKVDGVLVAPDALLLTRRDQIVTFLVKHKLPAMYPFREYAEVGGLAVHGANLSILFERAAGYVDRILKGAKPADLPVQLATEFELIINLKSAAEIGLAVSPVLIARADEVIQ